MSYGAQRLRTSALSLRERILAYALGTTPGAGPLPPHPVGALSPAIRPFGTTPTFGASAGQAMDSLAPRSAPLTRPELQAYRLAARTLSENGSANPHGEISQRPEVIDWISKASAALGASGTLSEAQSLEASLAEEFRAQFLSAAPSESEHAEAEHAEAEHAEAEHAEAEHSEGEHSHDEIASVSKASRTPAPPTGSSAPGEAALAGSGPLQVPENVRALMASTGSSRTIPQGVQPVATRGAQAARDLGFGGVIGGLGHRPNKSDHPVGLALDLMTKDQGVGDALKDFYIQNAKALGVKYIIWDKQIYDAQNGFKASPYSGRSPHTDHVHVSFAGDGTGGPLTSPAGSYQSGATSAEGFQGSAGGFEGVPGSKGSTDIGNHPDSYEGTRDESSGNGLSGADFVAKWILDRGEKRLQEAIAKRGDSWKRWLKTKGLSEQTPMTRELMQQFVADQIRELEAKHPGEGEKLSKALEDGSATEEQVIQQVTDVQSVVEDGDKGEK